METRWQCGKMQSLHLPTTRAPARCWWGALMPKEKGRTPKRTGRTCGDWEWRRSGDRKGLVPLRGGWEGGGVPTPGGTLRGSDKGGASPVFPVPNQQQKSAHISGQVLWPQRSPLGRVGPGDVGERPGRSGEPGGRGLPGPEEQERNGGCLPHPLEPRKPAGLTGDVPHPVRSEVGDMPGPLLFCWA